MSIFATALSLDADDHTERCARWIPLDDGVCCSGQLLVTPDRRYRYDNTQPCTCRTGPLRYDGSHILPSGDGPRAGSVELAEIPGFISRPGRELCGDEDGCPTAGDCCDRVWPFLRLWVSDGRPAGSEFIGSPVVLDATQVGRVHAYLGRWLKRAGEPR